MSNQKRSCSFLAGGKLVAILPTWGPIFSLEFLVKVHSFKVPRLQTHKWAEILRFTTSDKDCCSIGDRIPSVMTHIDNGIAVQTQIGDNGNHFHIFPNIVREEWQKIKIKQFKTYDYTAQGYHYEFKTSLERRRQWSVANNNPLTFTNVSVWLTAPIAPTGYLDMYLPPANVTIRLLYINDKLIIK